MARHTTLELRYIDRGDLEPRPDTDGGDDAFDLEEDDEEDDESDFDMARQIGSYESFGTYDEEAVAEHDGSNKSIKAQIVGGFKSRFSRVAAFAKGAGGGSGGTGTGTGSGSGSGSGENPFLKSRGASNPFLKSPLKPTATAKVAFAGVGRSTSTYTEGVRGERGLQGDSQPAAAQPGEGAKGDAVPLDTFLALERIRRKATSRTTDLSRLRDALMANAKRVSGIV